MDKKSELITDIFNCNGPFVFAYCGEPSSSEWLRARKGTVGGSDTPAVMGLHPYSTSMDVYIDKTTADTGEEMNEKMEWGLRHEPAMRKAFAEKVKRPVVSIPHILYANPLVDFPFDISEAILHANVDAIVLGEDNCAEAVLELKTTSQWSESWNPENQYPDWLDQDELRKMFPIEGKAPLWAWLQVQQNMLVTGLDMGYIALLRGGNEFTWEPVLKHEPTHGFITEAANRFVKEHVRPRIPVQVAPQHPKSRDSIKTRFGEVASEEIADLSEEDALTWRRLEDLKERRKEIDGEIKTIENSVYAKMGNAEFGVFPWQYGGYIRRKLVKTKGYWRPESESIRYYFSKKTLNK